MRSRASIAAALLGLVAVTTVAATAAHARQPSPVPRCQLAKLGAAAAELRARLLCDRGRGSALDGTPCAAAAAERRTAAFTRAERGALCPALDDAAQVGGEVESAASGLRFATVLRDDTASRRCATRQLTTAARAVWALARASVAHRRTGDDARFRAALERLRASFDAAYARLARSADCAAADAVAGDELFARVTGALDRLRRSTCPSCGAACPCWSTRELDTSLPPGALDQRGGAVCDQNGTGVVSADRCSVPGTRLEQPRDGANVAGALCVRWLQDADPDGDGLCDVSPRVAVVDPWTRASCAQALRSSQIRQASCAPDSAPRRIDALPGPRGEFVRDVGAREWILVGGPPGIVLPWDASPDAGPLPVPGCRLGESGECRIPIAIEAVGDTDWVVGRRFIGGNGGAAAFFALGPQGEMLPLPTRDDGESARFVRVGPGPLFFGDLQRAERVLPVVWTVPDAGYQELPVEGFASAPSPRRSDARQRIVGDAEEQRLPVLWTRAGDGYRLERLPLLDGDATGSATGIDADVVSGISGSRAVVWELGDGTIRVRELPRPRDVARCGGAVATSRGRVLGSCEALDGGPIGVVWTRDPEAADGWRDVHLLPPFPGDDGALVDGLRGDLVFGRSAFFGQGGGGREPRPVATTVARPRVPGGLRGREPGCAARPGAAGFAAASARPGLAGSPILPFCTIGLSKILCCVAGLAGMPLADGASEQRLLRCPTPDCT